MVVSLALSAVLLLIAWTWLRLAKREVSKPLWSTLEIPELSEDEAPLVSIILAAGNGGDHLRRCVESLLRQDYARFEVIVVVDQSRDGTWEHLQDMRAAGDGTLHVLRGTDLPPGWLRDPSAAPQRVEAASGEWLLFTDAHSYHAPNLLSRAMAYAKVRGLAMLSLAPRHECRTFWEHVSQPLTSQYLDLIMPMEQVGHPTAREAWASNSFLLITRAAYVKAGGHAVKAPKIHTAVALARRAKALGFPVEFVKAMDLLRVRMPHDLRELYVLLGPHPALVTAHALVIWGWTVLPFAALVPALSFGLWGLEAVGGWWDIVFAACVIFAVVTILQAQSVLRRVQRQNHRYAATLPLGGLCLGAAVIKALVQGLGKNERSAQASARRQ